MEPYGYSILAIPFFLVLGWVFFKRPDLRRHLLKLGIVGGFIGVIAQFWYLKDYWHPYTFLGHGVVSIEDFLVGFGLVALGALLPFYLLKLPWPKKQSGRRKRIALYTVGSLLVMIVFSSILGINSIISTYVIFGTLIVIGLVQRPWLWKSMLIGSGTIALIAFVIYGLWGITGWLDWRNPEMFLLVSKPGVSMLFGFLPVTELLWYTLWGATAAALPYIINNPSANTKS